MVYRVENFGQRSFQVYTTVKNFSFAYKEILIPLDTIHISDVQISRPMTVTINYHRYMIAYTRKNYDTLKELLRYGCSSNVNVEMLDKMKERSHWSMDR